VNNTSVIVLIQNIQGGVVEFIKTHLPNMIIMSIASGMMFFSSKTHNGDPIIIVGYLVVYLELAKLLYVALAGASAPILIRYVFAALTVGATIKAYEALIEFEPIKIAVYSGVALFYLLLRWIAIISTTTQREDE